MEKLNGLDLFSGIGGIGLGLSEWVRTVAYCEQDRYAQGVLLSRMRSGDIDKAPIWDDVKTLKGEMLPRIDIIFGGFPCQDISTAGTGKGLAGERSGLFFEIVRLVSDIRPDFVFLENVPAVTVRGLDRVCLEFAALGYDCRWTIVSAAEVGANHQRDRWFCLAINTNDRERSQVRRISERKIAESARICPAIQNSDGERSQKQRRAPTGSTNTATDASWWTTEPDICRVVDGLSFRVDRIRCLGNSVVPLAVEKAFKKLIGIGV